MKVLVIGQGGREHAMVWKLSQSRNVDRIFVTPGNAGMAGLAEVMDISPGDHAKLVDFARYEGIDLTIVGPEDPLSMGLVDAFEKAGRRVMGPRKAAAQLESSKAFAKDFMRKYNIPTAEYRSFASHIQAVEYIKLKGAPIVVKADGLAAGKGVLICMSHDEAMSAIDQVMKQRVFGDAGDRVVVEELLQGEEASFMAFCDGETILPMVSSQDHKRVGEGDTGLNTGGMGAYSPAPVVTPELEGIIMEKVMRPVLRGMRSEGIKFKGILYAGLMIKDGKPKVLEYNCRFGDPETQPILMRMETDFAEVCLAVAEERLSAIDLRWKPEASVCVVLASEGYPGSYPKGRRIDGLKDAATLDGVTVFHAGTSFGRDGEIVTSGGRVLGVTALGATLRSAKERAHEAISRIHFEGMHYRRDIGDRALGRRS